MATITNTEILDNIIEQLQSDCVYNDSKAFASYDENDILIEASVQWVGRYYENWINVDGVRYYEGVYQEINGYTDLMVDAWIDGEPVSVDLEYIERHLI